MATLLSCQCVKAQPLEDKLSSIYCALYAIQGSGGVTFPITPAQGGTGLTNYTVGDLIYANGATSLARLADVATGSVLLSGGVGVAPAYGKVGLTTHVSGTLGVANGGTGGTIWPKVIAYPSVNQTLTAGGTTDTIAFGTEVLDTDNAFAANTFTVPASAGGYYEIRLSCLYVSGGGDSSGVIMTIFVNGGGVARIYQDHLPTGFAYGLSGGTMIPLSVGDTVTVTITQFDAAAYTILGGISTLGRLSIYRVL